MSGTDFLCTSKTYEHASGKQHAYAMSLLGNEHTSFAGESAMVNAPIVEVPYNISDKEKTCIAIAYFPAVEILKFPVFAGS